MKRGALYTFLYIFFIAALAIAVFYTYSLLASTQAKLKENLEKLYTMQAIELARNTQKEINNHIHYNLVASLQKSQKLRRELTHALAMLPEAFYQQAYICTKTKSGDIRFLIGKYDRTKSIKFYEKIDFDKELIDRVYTQKHYLIVKKVLGDETKITFVSPVIVAKRVQGAFVLSFSFSLFDDINALLSHINIIFNAIVVIVLLIVVLLFLQEYVNVKTKKEVFVDALTGAYNRHYMRKFLEDADMDHYQIMLLDIDHFKKINDTYGHKAGDFVLSETAALIRSEIRSDDVFIRYGGEEFLLFIYRKDKNQHLAKSIAYRIKEKIQEHEFRHDDLVLRVTVSIGVNCFAEEFPKVSDAIKYADDMLYAAKRNGRNQVVSDLKKIKDFKVTKELTLFDVKEALAEHRVICFFQPVIEVKSQDVTHIEALIRIEDEHGEMLLPERFLDNVRNTNLYRALNMEVLERVFAVLPTCSVPISINLRLSDLLDDLYFDALVQKLEQVSTARGMLRIELEVSDKAENLERIAKRCDRLGELGVRFTLDRFGADSTFSLYEIFSTLPIDMINIDGAIIEKTIEEQTARKLVKSILYMAKELELKVTAEHVCSKEIYRYLEMIGIVYMAGFYISRPHESLDEIIKRGEDSHS